MDNKHIYLKTYNNILLTKITTDKYEDTRCNIQIHYNNMHSTRVNHIHPVMLVNQDKCFLSITKKIKTHQDTYSVKTHVIPVENFHVLESMSTLNLERMLRIHEMWPAGAPAVSSADRGRVALPGPGTTRMLDSGHSGVSP